MLLLRSSLDSKISLVNDQIARLRELDVHRQQEHHQSTVSALHAQHEVALDLLRGRLSEVQAANATVLGANAELKTANADLQHRNQELQHELVVQARTLAQQQAQDPHLHPHQHQQQHQQQQRGVRGDGHGEEKDSESVITVGKSKYDEQVQVIIQQSRRIEEQVRVCSI